jgi:hypothetical protein
MSTTSLKATKQQAHSPSKAEIVLTDSVKLSLATVTGEATKAFELYAKQQDASVAYETAENILTDELYSYLVETNPNYATYQAVKKHIINSISASKGRKYDTIEKWFNANIVKGVKALGYELPKAESKNAESMSKLRAELSSINTDELVLQIANLAKAGATGDKVALQRATQLASEKLKRDKQAANAIKKTESKAITEKKTEVKQWITSLDLEGLAAILYVKNHFDEIKKLAKITK